MKKLFSLILLATYASAVVAFDGGAQTAKLVEILKIAKEQAKLIKQNVEEAKFAGQSLKSINEDMREIYQDLQYIENFSLETEINGLKGSIENFTQLGKWSELDDKGRYLLLRREIDRRVTNDKNKDSFYKLAKKLEEQSAVEKAFMEQAQAATGGRLNSATSNGANVAANSVLAAEALAEQKERTLEEMREAYNANIAIENTNGFFSWLESEGEK